MTTRPASIPYLAFALATAAIGCTASGSAPAEAPPSPVERGSYLVTAAGCNDCHTPLKMGEHGPERDASRLLSGHPQDLAMPPAPAPSGPWIISAGATMTAWSGPWGVTFTANLTPDDETGLGAWDTRTFIDTIRNGRHMGRGRPLLPPMPSEMIAKLTDDDLAAVFAYLQSVPAVSNRVPEPIAPAVAETASLQPGVGREPR